MGGGAFGGQREEALRPGAVDKRRIVAMPLNGGKLVVIQSGPAQTLIVPGEAHRLDDMQAKAGVGAQADNIAGVRRDLWFE